MIRIVARNGKSKFIEDLSRGVKVMTVSFTNEHIPTVDYIISRDISAERLSELFEPGLKYVVIYTNLLSSGIRELEPWLYSVENRLPDGCQLVVTELGR